jgi:phospholipid/cholesterol/gamma-HCH transport system ATP-binding protein
VKIQIEHLKKSFNGNPVLNEVSLEICSGELMVILGESGSGKSVLLKHIMGLIKPDSGTIRIGDDEITDQSERHLLRLRRQIGYVFQEGALYDFMTVYDNIAFPLREHSRMTEAAIRSKVRDILSMVDLEDVELKFPVELSGGMRKRVGLARAIILDSKILLCDEPTSGLDPIRSRDISDLIRRVSKEIHCTTVITSHDMRNAFRIGDRFALLKDGNFVAVGTGDDVKNHSSDAFVREFIEA